mmetsp:Transcript_47109/g.131422  ORF Transcript_47109/g.131422 Transcript_47109/m.131422 type:complete len:208 (-) Transcript_47109:583-1206(-)
MSAFIAPLQIRRCPSGPALLRMRPRHFCRAGPCAVCRQLRPSTASAHAPVAPRRGGRGRERSRSSSSRPGGCKTLTRSTMRTCFPSRPHGARSPRKLFAIPRVPQTGSLAIRLTSLGVPACPRDTFTTMRSSMWLATQVRLRPLRQAAFCKGTRAINPTKRQGQFHTCRWQSSTTQSDLVTRQGQHCLRQQRRRLMRVAPRKMELRR